MTDTTLPTITSKPPTPAQPALQTTLALTPRNMAEAFQLADMLSSSTIVPSAYRGNPGNVLVAMQLASQLGMALLQAMSSIYVVDGKPKLYGDAPLAICRASTACEWVRESFDEESMAATCSAKRRGERDPIIRSFSEADARKAGLWGKNVWAKHPKRMLQMRARSWCLNDAFPDALMGLQVLDLPVEEVDRAIAEQEAQVRRQVPARAPQRTPQQTMAGRIRKAMHERGIGQDECERIAQSAIGFVPDRLEDLSPADAHRLLDFVNRGGVVEPSAEPAEPADDHAEEYQVGEPADDQAPQIDERNVPF